MTTVLTDYKRLEQRIRPGDIVWTWCSKHMDRTSHVYTGNKLICIECHPDWEQMLAAEKDKKKK